MTRRGVVAGVAVALVLAASGCGGGPKYVPVSGVVMLDGKPYGKAVVSFQPIGTTENPTPGRGSSAYTDENGRFVLKCDDGTDGAVVGKHRLRIMTKGNDVVQLAEGGGSVDGGAPVKGNVDPIPADWGTESTREVDVPAAGLSDLTFEITSAKGKKK
jgi:hypothetical protein